MQKSIVMSILEITIGLFFYRVGSLLTADEAIGMRLMMKHWNLLKLRRAGMLAVRRSLWQKWDNKKG